MWWDANDVHVLCDLRSLGGFLLPIPQTTSLAVSPISQIRQVGSRRGYRLASGRAAAGAYARSEVASLGVVEITNPHGGLNRTTSTPFGADWGRLE